MSDDKSWTKKPLVSALMVHTRSQQAGVARDAIKSLLQQDWPHLEVVVYNATSRPLYRWEVSRVTELNLRPDHHATMLSIALNNCDGEWCAITCPDCWYYPTYISAHMQNAQKRRLSVADLKYAYGLRCNGLVVTSDPKIPSSVFYRFHRVKLHKPLEPQFEETVRVAHSQPLFVKFAREIVNQATASS